MAIDGALPISSLISRLQKIYVTLRDSVDINSPFYTFIKSYSKASRIQLFSCSLKQALVEADFRYDPSDADHKFNRAIKSLESDPVLLEKLFDRSGYKKVKRCYIDNIISLEALDRSYQSYLEKNISPLSSQIITPMFSQQCAQNQPKPFSVNDIYLYSLFLPANTFQNLNEIAREHFLEALIHLRELCSNHLVTLLSCQANEDLDCFLIFINSKLEEASNSSDTYSNYYSEFKELAITIFAQRYNRELDDIENERKMYREYGLENFTAKKSAAGPA